MAEPAVSQWSSYGGDLAERTEVDRGHLDDRLLPSADLAGWGGASAPERQWVVRDLVPTNQMTLLTGAGATGKSLLVQQLCTCIAAGRPFLGIPIARKPSLYVTCEDDQDELWRRQEAICRMIGVDMASLAGSLDIVSLAGEGDCALALFEGATEGDIDTRPQEAGMRATPRLRAISAAARERRYGLIGLDNTAQLFSGNENIRHEVASFASLMTGLAIASQGAVMLIGHPNKAGEQYSGSTAWNNQVRSRLFLERGDEFDRDSRTLIGAKANYSAADSALRFRWKDWAFVADVELDETERASIQDTAAASADNETFLRCLRAVTEQGRHVSANWGPNYAPAVFEDNPIAKQAGAKKKRLTQAMERLFAIGRIESGFIRRDTNKGRDIHGIVEVEQ